MEAPEVWLPCSLRYEVSSHGRYRRSAPGAGTRAGNIITPYRYKTGYLMVNLEVRVGRERKRYVHRLVADAFLGPCPDGLEVNHKDGDKTNNRADNLEYVTRAGNNRHAWATGLMHSRRGEDVPSSRLKERDVLEIRRRAEGGERKTIIAKEYGLSRHTVHGIVSRRSWKHI